MKQNNKRGIKILYRVIAIISILGIAIAGWKLYDIWNEGHQIKKETEELKQFLRSGEDDSQNPEEPEGFVVDWNGLKAANPNVIAWIAIPDTGISYPVVQGQDNVYYLNHSYTGVLNSMGSIFLDSELKPDFSEDNSIIYGHSVSDIGGMFTSLDKFNDPEFFNSHPYFWLLTPSQNYRVETYAFYQGSDESPIYTVDFGDFRQDILKKIEKESTYVHSISLNDKKFITLSTCDLKYGFYSNQRYVLMGALEKWDENIPAQEIQ